MQKESENTAIQKIVRKAGAELARLQRDRMGLNPRRKPDGSEVSNADYVSDDILVRGLRSIFPTASIYSEEGELPESYSGDYWLLDPLDGTARYLAGYDDYCVLVAHVIAGGPENGWMYFPAQDVLLESASHFRLQATLSPQSIGVRGVELTSQQLIMPHRVHSGMLFYKYITGALCALVMEMEGLGRWDVAAPLAIIRSAGGRALNQNGADFPLSGDNFEAQTLIVSHPECIDEAYRLYQDSNK